MNWVAASHSQVIVGTKEHQLSSDVCLIWSMFLQTQLTACMLTLGLGLGAPSSLPSHSERIARRKRKSGTSKSHILLLIGLNRSSNLEKINPDLTPDPTRVQTFSQPNHVWSWSNFQDIFLTIYQHDLWCQIWPHPPSLQSGTPNVLQAFLGQIMYDLDKTFGISSWPSINMIYDVKCDPILQVSNQEPSMSSKPPTQAFSAKSCSILIKLSGDAP